MSNVTTQIAFESELTTAGVRSTLNDRGHVETNSIPVIDVSRNAELVHEINSPLAYSLLSAQIALRTLSDDADPAVRRCIERAIEGIHRASVAARELLRRD